MPQGLKRSFYGQPHDNRIDESCSQSRHHGKRPSEVFSDGTHPTDGGGFGIGGQGRIASIYAPVVDAALK